MHPVKNLPVDHLDGRVIGSTLTLANGSNVFGVLGNIDISNSKRTQQYLLLTLYKARKRFNLARYFDGDYAQRGPVQAAAFLGLTPEAVFPISYNISGLVNAPIEVTVPSVAIEPRERLTLSERIKL